MKYYLWERLTSRDILYIEDRDLEITPTTEAGFIELSFQHDPSWNPLFRLWIPDKTIQG